MAEVYVYRDGSRFTPAMAFDFDAMDRAFEARFGYTLLASSAVRLLSEQEAIFRARYVPASQVNGRYVYDYRTWKGVLWARISPAGTVAAPDSPQANHVLENGSGAVDIRDSGPNAGVLTPGTERHRWIRDWCREFGYEPEGDKFGEPWHLKYVRNAWASVDVRPFPTPADPTNPVTEQEEDEMEAIVVLQSGTVEHLTRGHKYEFTSQRDYELYRSEVILYKGKGTLAALTPPPWDTLAATSKVPWDVYHRMLDHFGIPRPVTPAPTPTPVPPPEPEPTPTPEPEDPKA